MPKSCLMVSDCLDLMLVTVGDGDGLSDDTAREDGDGLSDSAAGEEDDDGLSDGAAGEDGDGW